jgi:hypothetical protein
MPEGAVIPAKLAVTAVARLHVAFMQIEMVLWSRPGWRNCTVTGIAGRKPHITRNRRIREVITQAR